ncbi:MAG: hypothetical protein MUF54_19155, partial [Polyangiaceae bacterium]|nr:hypothetical protein [Polyangiaceae bacterium]
LCEHVSNSFAALGAEEAAAFATHLASLDTPTRRNQGELDAFLCLLTAVTWRTEGLRASAVLGDTRGGYFVVPMHPELADDLAPDLTSNRVPFEFHPLNR